MNEAMINLLTRRSVRKYKKEQISDSELQAVLGAGTYAPTARSRRSSSPCRTRRTLRS